MVRMVPCYKPLLLDSQSQLLCSSSLEFQIGIESRRSDACVTQPAHDSPRHRVARRVASLARSECGLLWWGGRGGGWGRAPSTSTGGRARGGGYVGATSAEALLSAGHGGSRGALRAVVACLRQRGRGLYSYTAVGADRLIG
jgi:hypothetical protein